MQTKIPATSATAGHLLPVACTDVASAILKTSRPYVPCGVLCKPGLNDVVPTSESRKEEAGGHVVAQCGYGLCTLSGGVERFDARQVNEEWLKSVPRVTLGLRRYPFAGFDPNPGTDVEYCNTLKALMSARAFLQGCKTKDGDKAKQSQSQRSCTMCF